MIGGPAPPGKLLARKRFCSSVIQRLFATAGSLAMADRIHQQPPADEVELIEQARRQDPAAVRRILQRHRRRLYRIARSIVRDESEAEDVLQEAYMRAFADLSTFRGEARFSTWLTRIVINEALGWLRRQRPALDLSVGKAPNIGAQIIPFPHASAPLDPEARMAQHEIRTLLEQAIDRLPNAFGGDRACAWPR